MARSPWQGSYFEATGRKLEFSATALGSGRKDGLAMLVLRCMALLILAPGLAMGQADAGSRSYPSRAVRIVVPFPAGGPTDILSRVVGQRLSETWSQPVVI